MLQVTRRTAERVTAAAVVLFGGIVAVDSLSHDIGWNANGPGPGYFPFRVGLLLVAASIAIAVQAGRSEAGAIFVRGKEIGRSFSVFWPAAATVGGMFVLGCYVPSLVYLAWMMRVHGRFGWARALPAAAAAITVLFLIFEVWFQVPLAKGPVEAALGLY
jgi:hypothetical protein